MRATRRGKKTFGTHRTERCYQIVPVPQRRLFTRTFVQGLDDNDSGNISGVAAGFKASKAIIRIVQASMTLLHVCADVRICETKVKAQKTKNKRFYGRERSHHPLTRYFRYVPRRTCSCCQYVLSKGMSFFLFLSFFPYKQHPCHHVWFWRTGVLKNNKRRRTQCRGQ